MKIQFPNPDDYIDREELFFEQLELCVYHAKKAWHKIRSQEIYQGSDRDHQWLSFGFPSYVHAAVEDAKDGNGKYIDPNQEGLKEVSIVINEL